jgi:hypothetical protein
MKEFVWGKCAMPRLCHAPRASASYEGKLSMRHSDWFQNYFRRN